MDSIFAIAFGLAVRVVVDAVGHEDNRLTGTLVGLWEGIVMQHFLKKMPKSFDPYVAYGVRLFIDFLFTESLSRLVLTLIWTGMGIVLADVAPAIWIDAGLRRFWRRFRRDLYVISQSVPTIPWFARPRTVRFSPSRPPTSVASELPPSVVTADPQQAPTETSAPPSCKRPVPGAFPGYISETDTDIGSVLGLRSPRSDVSSSPGTTHHRYTSLPRRHRTTAETESERSVDLDEGNISSSGSSYTRTPTMNEADMPIIEDEEDVDTEREVVLDKGKQKDDETTPKQRPLNLPPTPSDSAAPLPPNQPFAAHEPQEVQPPAAEVPNIPDDDDGWQNIHRHEAEPVPEPEVAKDSPPTPPPKDEPAQKVSSVPEQRQPTPPAATTGGDVGVELPAEQLSSPTPATAGKNKAKTSPHPPSTPKVASKDQAADSSTTKPIIVSAAKGKDRATSAKNSPHPPSTPTVTSKDQAADLSTAKPAITPATKGKDQTKTSPHLPSPVITSQDQAADSSTAKPITTPAMTAETPADPPLPPTAENKAKVEPSSTTKSAIPSSSSPVTTQFPAWGSYSANPQATKTRGFTPKTGGPAAWSSLPQQKKSLSGNLAGLFPSSNSGQPSSLLAEMEEKPAGEPVATETLIDLSSDPQQSETNPWSVTGSSAIKKDSQSTTTGQAGAGTSSRINQTSFGFGSSSRDRPPSYSSFNTSGFNFGSNTGAYNQDTTSSFQDVAGAPTTGDEAREERTADENMESVVPDLDANQGDGDADVGAAEEAEKQEQTTHDVAGPSGGGESSEKEPGASFSEFDEDEPLPEESSNRFVKALNLRRKIITLNENILKLKRQLKAAEADKEADLVAEKQQSVDETLGKQEALKRKAERWFVEATSADKDLPSNGITLGESSGDGAAAFEETATKLLLNDQPSFEVTFPSVKKGGKTQKMKLVSMCEEHGLQCKETTAISGTKSLVVTLPTL